MSRQRQGGFLVAKIHQAGGRIFARMLRERGLEVHPAHGRVLFVLWQEGALTVYELAKRVSLNKSTLTNTIDALEAAGLVTRTAVPGDRRKILVEPTAKNRALQAAYDEVSQEMSELFYRGFSEAEVDRFEASLERILENVEASEKG